MPQRIQTYPNLRQHSQAVTLSGQSYRLRLTWRQRNQGWYLDLYEDDNTPLLLGRRLSPGWSPDARTRVLPGLLYVKGPSPYDRSHLGGRLTLLYYEPEEL